MSVRVDVDNFKRAESDTYFAKFVKDAGIGRFGHRREPAAIDEQDVIRMNRDTLYSSAVVDLCASPATVTMPEAGGRFMAMQVINEDHYTTDAHVNRKAGQLVYVADLAEEYGFTDTAGTRVANFYRAIGLVP